MGAQDDAMYMRHACELAVRASGNTNPNPLVGAVVVRDGTVIGEGFHERYGELHAERRALVDCHERGEDPSGATIYVTLEPCSHHGHQPPCADALVEAGVKRVVIGSSDPNPLVAGKGVKRLRAAGIEVLEGVERDRCDAINQVFFHFITTGRPYVVCKWAMTADGRIASASGDARWVTGELSRAHGHALRNRLAAIMVGSRTVALDNPQLTCRLEGGRTPVRVVCDSRLSISPESALVRSAHEGRVVVASASLADDALLAKARTLRDTGVEVLELPGADGRVDLVALMAQLGAEGIDSVLVEGGAQLHAAVLGAGLANEVVAYIAPKVVGGTGAAGPVGGAGVMRMADALVMGAPSVEALGDNVRMSWRLGTTKDERARPCVSSQDMGPVWHAAKARLCNAENGGE